MQLIDNKDKIGLYYFVFNFIKEQNISEFHFLFIPTVKILSKASG